MAMLISMLISRPVPGAREVMLSELSREQTNGRGKKSLKLISSLTTMPTSQFTDAMQEFLRQFTRFFLVRLQRTEKK